jgi:hypothetical protein
MPYTILGQSPALANEPQVIGGVTYVPLRDVITALGGTLDWDPQNRVVACRLDSWRATMKDGSNEADVSGTPVTFSSPVKILADTAWVPLDFFQSAFGLLASANGTDVYITNPNA